MSPRTEGICSAQTAMRSGVRNPPLPRRMVAKCVAQAEPRIPFIASQIINVRGTGRSDPSHMLSKKS